MNFPEKCNFDDFIKIIEELIPVLLEFLAAFIFILLMYNSQGKRKELYWFSIIVFLIFDILTLGITIPYLQAISHCTCASCDEDL